MVTTIQVSETLKERLKAMKLYDSETYEEVLWDLIEDVTEVDEEFKKEILAAAEQVKEGKVIELSKVKESLGI